MKRKALTIAAVLLLLVGLGVFLYPTFYDLYSRWQAEQVIEQYTYVAEPDKADYSAEWAAADAYNETVAENGIFSSAVYALDPSQLLNPLGTGMMGYLDIPKIDVHLPIYQGHRGARAAVRLRLVDWHVAAHRRGRHPLRAHRPHGPDESENVYGHRPVTQRSTVHAVRPRSRFDV